MDYDLTRLGPREFEHLVQAMALKVLGAQVGVFGDGPDGGREAAFTGTAVWSREKPETWNGFIVVQAKFRQRPLGTTQDSAWFKQQVETELRKWADAGSRHPRRAKLAEYLLLATNVVLSATEQGGIDTIDRLVGTYTKQIGLKGHRVWHYDQICRLLDNATDIRKTFGGLITPGDVLTRLHDMLVGDSADLGQTLTAHVAKDLLAERWVRLGQAGQPLNEKLSLDQVAIDLRARRGRGDPPDTVDVVAHVIERGDQVLRPSIVEPGNDPSHLVLMGGPGQGKTTIGQLLGQAYRATLLADVHNMGPDVAEVVRGTRQTLTELGIREPSSKRWPARLDLASYGDAIGGGQDLSILRWLAVRASARSGIDINAAQLRSWLHSWPWLLILDGLDEVASLHARDHLMRQIDDFLIDAASVDADLLIIGATRPQGYTGEFSSRRYEHLTLEPLSAAEALRYATRLADVRHHGDPDLRQQTLDRVTEAAHAGLTARLMRTPLQVTIMSLLLERRPRPPQDRHGLFEAYYDTIYAREVSKPGYLGKLLDEHRADIHALHEQVGLRLQILAESAGEADSSLPSEDLQLLAMDRLEVEGYNSDSAERLAAEIVKAATNRLVLLVPKAQANVGFEVRSLQEFMAARAVASGPDQYVIQRLRVMAPAIHWRNTWLLAVGRVFNTREHLRAQVVALLREVDSEDLLAAAIPIGPDLAFNLLYDDIAVRSPQFRRQLLLHGLELFEQSPVADVVFPAWTINDLYKCDDLRPLIIRALEQGLAAASDRQATTLLILNELNRYTGSLARRARQLRNSVRTPEDQQLALSTWQHLPSGFVSHPSRKINRRRLSDYVEASLRNANLAGTDTQVVDDFLAALHQVRLETLPPDYQTCLPPDRLIKTSVAESVVTDPAVANAVAEAILRISPKSWVATATLKGLILAARQRQPVGNQIMTTFQ